MSKNVLNLIIIFSCILLVAAFFINPPFGQNQNQTNQNIIITPFPTQPLATVTPANILSKLVSCNNPYLPFQKGKKFTYRVTSTPKLKTEKPIIFTNTVIEASGSSAIVETKFAKDSKINKSKMTCRKSGIYGFPFSYILFTQSDTFSKQFNLETTISSLLESFLILPDQLTIDNKKSWSYPLVLENIPIRFMVEGKVKNNTGNILTLSQSISPAVDFVKTTPLSNSIEIISQFRLGLGIVEYRLKVKAEKPTEMVIKLDSF